MLAAERRALLLRAVRASRSARVGELAARFGVSEMTIRRDLDLLAGEGKLTRTHGGAFTDLTEPPFDETVVERLDPKDRIGALAARMVSNGEAIIVDIGTTTLQLARHLHDREVTVITSNLAVVEELMPDPAVELIVLGGVVRRNYRSLVGFLAEDALRQLSADRAFLGTSGIRADLSIMDSTMVEIPVKRAMINTATQVVLLADAGKFGVGGGARVCGPQEIDVLVTDQEAPATMVEAFERASVKVERA